MLSEPVIQRFLQSRLPSPLTRIPALVLAGDGSTEPDDEMVVLGVLHNHLVKYKIDFYRDIGHIVYVIRMIIQYSSRVIWYYIQQNRLFGSKSIEKIKRLENIFSTFRKILRFGRFIESFYGASQSLKGSDQLLKFTSILSKLAFGMYLFCDHVICLEKTGLMEIQYQKWYLLSSKYWFYALFSLLLRDVYELLQVVSVVKKQPVRRIGSMLYNDHKDIIIDTFKNFFDILIPMTALGYLKLSPGAVGVAGTVSSALGLLPIVQPLFKMRPC